METFEAWMAKVDSEIQQRVGCFAADLPDFDYRTFYDDEASPNETAIAAIAEV